MTRRQLILASLFAATTCAAVAAVALRRLSHDAQSTQPSIDTPLSQLHRFNVRLGWLPNANSAGQIVAKSRGFYAAEGLDVTLHAGGLADPSVRSVAAGVDDVGFANGPELVIAARAAGAPLKIVAVVHSIGLSTFVVRQGSDIRSPADWPGNRIGVKVGSPTYSHYLALTDLLRVDRTRIEEVPVRADTHPFLDGRVHVYPCSRTNEAVQFEMSGIPIRCINPEDYGIPTMGHVLFASESTLREDGDNVRRFVRATRRGWDWCRDVSNRDLAVEMLVQHNAALDRAKERLALDRVIALVGDLTVDETKFEQVIQSQWKHAGLQRQPNVSELIHSLPTLKDDTGSP